MPIRGVVLSQLRRLGLYTRPHELRDGRLWCPISQANMSTEFAVSRFLVPMLARAARPRGERGWALFMDCDMLVRGNLMRLLDMADSSYAVMCVKHAQESGPGTKMDGQAQQFYKRKNWSSVVLWNLDHEANDALTPEMVNMLPGRDLHAFCWLTDDLIGELGLEWNWLAGVSPPLDDPKIVHHTLGSPCLPGFENVPFAEEWRIELERWATA